MSTTTTIEYALSEKAAIQLAIFNVMGQQMKSVVNERQQKGSYQYEIPFDEFSQGIYFYKFTANKKSQYGKIILLK